MIGQFYTLKTPHPLLPDRWKVTSEFYIQTGPNTFTECVRLRHGINEVRYFTAAEVKRLFDRIEHKEAAAKL